jgi:lipopolysaccharide export LptBFGC system permease protein LptF
VRLDRGALHQIGDAPGEYRVVEFASNSVSLDIGKVIDSRTKFFQEAGMMSAGELAGAVDAEPPGSAERRRLSVLLHSRFSMALAPFLLVLLVIPLAAARFSAGRPVNISLALLVLLFYYVSLRTGMSSGETGRLAPWLAVWLPNVLLLAAAAVAPAVRGTAR